MKYPLFFGGLLAAILIGSVIFFTTGFPDIAFFEAAYSTIVNLPNIFPYFVPIAITFAIGITAFVYFSFRALNHDNASVRGLLISGFVAGLLLVLTPYDKSRYWFWLIHTAMGFVIAAIIVFLGLEFRKIEQPQRKALAWMKKNLPPALGIGTAGLTIIAGLNMLMETYFFVVTSLWLIVVSVTVNQVKK